MKGSYKAALLLGISAAVIAAASIAILVNRVDAGFMTEDNDGKALPCGEVHWASYDFPVPVMLEHSSTQLRTEAATLSRQF